MIQLYHKGLGHPDKKLRKTFGMRASFMSQELTRNLLNLLELSEA